ncbi:hypothetical protein GJQ57_23720 [Ralstonia pickettii]|uniref:Toxin co-regulated pilus biosynthesis protein Q C-terminal domain-containing protein n=1 Tax=Ralstonia pickettii TaxID=329 RepID=A0A7X2LBZ8_RALPI|nr:toxin co-regulated pilus biosynthesis Q family protein [Ralstonia pickettii]MRT01659.1 hypothetical protein [Ralstonia pickettii]
MRTFHPLHRAVLIFYLLAGLGVTVDAQARTASAQTKAAADWQQTPDGTWQRIADANNAMEPSPEEGWQLLGSTPASPSKSAPVRSAAVTEMPNGKRLSEVSRSAAAPVAPPAPTADAFVLVKGKSMQAQLESWAARAGWTVEWNVPDDWIVPNDQPLGNDFAHATQQTIEQLAANGADVQADIWKGNQVVVVHPAGVGE